MRLGISALLVSVLALASTAAYCSDPETATGPTTGIALSDDWDSYDSSDESDQSSNDDDSSTERDDGRLPSFFNMDVPAEQQNPELPTGCESVALTNALLYYGFDLEKTTIADEWLPKSEEDFVYSFLGDPRNPEANSCMAPCIVITANDYLSSVGSDMEATDISGSSFDDILALVAEGYPVIVWNTIDLVEVYEPYLSQEEDGITYYLYENSHCVVVSGFDQEEDVVYVSDSLAGQVSYDRELLEARYRDLGSQAVLIS